MTRIIWMAAVVLAALVSAPAMAQKVDLRPKWAKGAQWRFRMEQSSTNTVKLTGDDSDTQKTTVSQDARLLLKVIDSQPEGDSTVELVVESSKASMDAGDGKREFDSSKPKDKDESGGMAAGLRALVGTKLTLIVAPDGHIKEIKGGEGLPSSELITPFTDPGKATQLLGPVTSIKKGDGFASVGQSWENEDAVESGLLGRIRMVNKHTLRSAAGGVAKIAMDGRIEADSESPDSPFKIRDGKFTGTCDWDTRGGMLRAMESRMSFKIEAQGLEFASMSSEATQRITRIE